MKIYPVNLVKTTGSATHNNNQQKNVGTVNSKDSTDSSLMDYMREKDRKEQKEKNIGYIVGGGIAAACLAAFFVVPKLRGRATNTKINEFLEGFENLKNDSSIPTLETCKSINPKLKTFLENQLMLAKATEDDLIKTGSPKAANRLLMCGEPGSGKSFFAKIFAKSLNAEYLEIKYSDLNRQYCGEHLENVKHIFERILDIAKKKPEQRFVVTFNEIDSLAVPIESLQGASSHSSFKREERSTFLTYIDELAEKVSNVTLIGTTNVSPKNGGFDGAISSRFKNLIEVSNPDIECMNEALKELIMTLPEGKGFIERNSDRLEDFAQNLTSRKASYRNLNQIVESSKNFYLRDVLKDKNSSFKIEYLERARDMMGATDGEIARSTRKVA